MASRLGQHLLREKSKAENFGLFGLYFSYFVSLSQLPHDQFLAVSRQTVSLTHSMLITAFELSVFSPGLVGEVGSLPLIECPVSFDHNFITPQIAENTLPRLKPSFSIMWKCPQNAKQVQLVIVVAFRLAKYLIGCKMKGSKLYLFADKSVT